MTSGFVNGCLHNSDRTSDLVSILEITRTMKRISNLGLNPYQCFQQFGSTGDQAGIGDVFFLAESRSYSKALITLRAVEKPAMVTRFLHWNVIHLAREPIPRSGCK